MRLEPVECFTTCDGGVSVSVSLHSQGCNRRERLQPNEEGGEVVHLWVLQKTEGQQNKHIKDPVEYLVIEDTKVTMVPNPQGLKKPYNPIIGETYRCMWLHHKTNSKTFYIAEQVMAHEYQLPLYWRHSSSHGDGISFHFSPGIPSSPSVCLLCQQQEGWILPKRQHPRQIQVLRYTSTLSTKIHSVSPPGTLLKVCTCLFICGAIIHLLVDSICPLTAVVYPPGNSLSAILDGEARLTFLNRGEDYVMNMPYAHCKGEGAAFCEWMFSSVQADTPHGASSLQASCMAP